MSLSRAGWCFALLALACGGMSAADSGDLPQQLAAAQDRLSTALHSYSLLQDENQKLKDEVQKGAAERAALQAQLDSGRQANASLKTAAAAAAQLDGVREQLRQARDQVAALARQNYELRNQLAAAPAPRK